MSLKTPFQYNGQWGIMTEANGLLNMRARYYSPYLMRFLNADPIGFSGGSNWFAYAGGDPIRKTDPFGLFETFGEYLGEVGDVWLGYGDAAVGTVTGIANLVVHPIDSAKGVGHAVSHPVETYNAISNSVSDLSQTNRGMGRIIGEVLITAATAGATKATSVAGRSSELVKVTRWGRPGLEAGDWVMKGGKTPLNYRLSGKFQNGYGNKFASFESGTTFEVAAGSLYKPKGLVQGLNPFDGRAKSLIPGQRRYTPHGEGLVTPGESLLYNTYRASVK